MLTTSKQNFGVAPWTIDYSTAVEYRSLLNRSGVCD